MKKRLGAVLGVAALCLASAAAAETIVIPGSGSSQSMLRELATAFEKKNPGVQIEIPDSIGTGGGMKAAGEGKAVIARVGRKPNDKEAAYGLSFLAFARQPVVFATHPSVKLKGITRAQSRDLFTGKIASWKEVGGPDLKVRVISRPTSETNFKLLQQTIPEWKDLVVTERSKSAATDQEMVQFIAEYEGAIGFNVVSEVLEKGLSPCPSMVSPPATKPIRCAWTPGSSSSPGRSPAPSRPSWTSSSARRGRESCGRTTPSRQSGRSKERH